jgi:hypothetical protein
MLRGVIDMTSSFDSEVQFSDEQAQQTYRRETGLSYITLFATTGTLVCCALPIVLVSVGLGAAVASLTSLFPGLVLLSKYKLWVFASSGVLLGVTAWSIWRPGRACPADPVLAAKCVKAERLSRCVFWSAVAVWGVGFFAAYLALPLRIKLGI